MIGSKNKKPPRRVCRTALFHFHIESRDLVNHHNDTGDNFYVDAQYRLLLNFATLFYLLPSDALPMKASDSCKIRVFTPDRVSIWVRFNYDGSGIVLPWTSCLGLPSFLSR